jgi:hypothetical protein
MRVNFAPNGKFAPNGARAGPARLQGKMESPQRQKLREALYLKLIGDAPGDLEPAVLAAARVQVADLLSLPRLEMRDLTAAIQRIGCSPAPPSRPEG